MLQHALATLSVVDSITGDVRRKHLDKQPEEEFLGPHGVMRYLQGSTGQSLCCYFWPAIGEAKAVVQLVHSMGSFLCFDFLPFKEVGAPKLYEGSWIQTLNRAGYSVCGCDHQGFGRSSGLFGYVRSYKDWVADQLVLTRVTKDSDVAGFRQLPVYLMGISIGGNLALHAAIAEPGLYAGIVLLAPMLSLENVKKAGSNKHLQWLAYALNWIIPTWPLVQSNKNTMFPDLQQDWETHPVTYHYWIRVRIGCECMTACADAMASLGRLALPLLVFHSANDTMTDPEGSKQLVAAAQSPDKRLQAVDHMWHVLAKEPGNQQVLEAILGWLAPRTQQAAASKAAAAATANGGAGAAAGKAGAAAAAAANGHAKGR